MFPRDCAKPPVGEICNHGAQKVLIEIFTFQIRYLQNIDVNLWRRILTNYRLTFIGVREERNKDGGVEGRGVKYGWCG